MQRLLTNAVKSQFRQALPVVGGASMFPNGPQQPASDSAGRLRTGAVPNSLNDPKELELNGRKKRG